MEGSGKAQGDTGREMCYADALLREPEKDPVWTGQSAATEAGPAPAGKSSGL